MTSKEWLDMQLENFINYFTSNEKEREDMYACITPFMDEVLSPEEMLEEINKGSAEEIKRINRM